MKSIKHIEDVLGPPNTWKGFAHSPTIEQTRRWRELSLEDRLRWLEQANRFLQEAMTEEEKKVARRFREGKI